MHTHIPPSSSLRKSTLSHRTLSRWCSRPTPDGFNPNAWWLEGTSITVSYPASIAHSYWPTEIRGTTLASVPHQTSPSIISRRRVALHYPCRTPTQDDAAGLPLPVSPYSASRSSPGHFSPQLAAFVLPSMSLIFLPTRVQGLLIHRRAVLSSPWFTAGRHSQHASSHCLPAGPCLRVSRNGALTTMRCVSHPFSQLSILICIICRSAPQRPLAAPLPVRSDGVGIETSRA